jgi:hypothetical protein
MGLTLRELICYAAYPWFKDGSYCDFPISTAERIHGRGSVARQVNIAYNLVHGYYTDEGQDRDIKLLVDKVITRVEEYVLSREPQIAKDIPRVDFTKTKSFRFCRDLIERWGEKEWRDFQGAMFSGTGDVEPLYEAGRSVKSNKSDKSTISTFSLRALDPELLESEGFLPYGDCVFETSKWIDTGEFMMSGAISGVPDNEDRTETGQRETIKLEKLTRAADTDPDACLDLEHAENYLWHQMQKHTLIDRYGTN